MAIAVAEPSKWLITVQTYHRIIEAGILGPQDRVELIEGEIIKMASIGRRHAVTVKKINRIFSRILGERAVVGIQDPLEMENHSEPEPDFILLRNPMDIYEERKPIPADVLLILEVSDSSLVFDRKEKGHLYAKANIQEYWIANLEEDIIEVYREPDGQHFKLCMIKKNGETVSPLAFPDVQIPVSDIIK